jgi:hypothetical protein
MSSATSIDPSARPVSAGERLPERGAGGKRGEAEPQSAGKAGAEHGFRPWHFFVLLSLIGATVAVVMTRQPTPEHLVLLSLTIGAGGLCGAAFYAALVPLVRKDAEGSRAPLSDRTRAALEREKMLVLRSIKELEFDRAMGKVSPGDFDEIVGRLRARAIGLMKQLETPAPGYRARIEQELAARVERAVPNVQTCTCGTVNDADAAFCKRCGNRLRTGQRLRPERGAEPPNESERQP